MKRDLEALLFATDQPLGMDRLVKTLGGAERAEVREALDELREEYEKHEHAFTIVEFGGGYSISTRPEHAKLVRRLFRGRRKQRLSKAALEALAIIAYKQPVTRLEIEEIRGVSASGVLGTLLERDLIQIAGRAETLGHPLLYATTRSFLDYLGLSRIQDLPQLSELEDLLAEKEELKQIAARYGGELEDEDFDRALQPGDEDEEETEDETGEAEDGSEEGEVAAPPDAEGETPAAGAVDAQPPDAEEQDTPDEGRPAVDDSEGDEPEPDRTRAAADGDADQ